MYLVADALQDVHTDALVHERQFGIACAHVMHELLCRTYPEMQLSALYKGNTVTDQFPANSCW